jgi:hypothetical protein
MMVARIGQATSEIRFAFVFVFMALSQALAHGF